MVAVLKPVWSMTLSMLQSFVLLQWAMMVPIEYLLQPVQTERFQLVPQQTEVASIEPTTVLQITPIQVLESTMAMMMSGMN